MTQRVGWAFTSQGRFAEAVALQPEAHRLAIQLEHKAELRASCIQLAVVLAHCGRPHRAAELSERGTR